MQDQQVQIHVGKNNVVFTIKKQNICLCADPQLLWTIEFGSMALQ